jgi:hypothetical protein
MPAPFLRSAAYAMLAQDSRKHGRRVGKADPVRRHDAALPRRATGCLSPDIAELTATGPELPTGWKAARWRG